MTIYTVVGWLLERGRSRCSYFDAPSARTAIDGARAQAFDRTRSDFSPDWRMVIAVPGKRSFAARYETLQPGIVPAAGRLETFTAIGFWRNSMETIHRAGPFASAAESLLLTLAELGTPDEIQMVGAFAGAVSAEQRRETLPPTWDMIGGIAAAPAEPRLARGGRR